MPSPNSILDNLNCLSSDTYAAIHKTQLAMIMVMDLDDFCRVYIDSTTVEANSAWPTDSRIILKLIRRIFKMGNKLRRFGLANFTDNWVPFWLKALGTLDFAIDNLGNTRGSRRKRKVLYRKFLDKAEKALEYLYGELEKANDSSFGLQAGIFTRDIHHAFRAFNELEVGGISVGQWIDSGRIDATGAVAVDGNVLAVGSPALAGCAA